MTNTTHVLNGLQTTQYKVLLQLVVCNFLRKPFYYTSQTDEMHICRMIYRYEGNIYSALLAGQETALCYCMYQLVLST